MKLWIGIIAYDDADSLRRCLAACRALYPSSPIAVVDGRYRSFPGKAAASTDGTMAVAVEHGAVCIDSWPDGWPTQYVKRNWQFCGAQVDDWVFCIDSDEYPELPQPEKFWAALADPHAGDYRVEVAYPTAEGGAAMHRLFRMTDGFHVFGAHWCHWRSGLQYVQRKDDRRLPFSVVRLRHEPVRSLHRQRRREEYYNGPALEDEWRHRQLVPLFCR